MTVDVRPQSVDETLAEISKRLFRVEQDASRPTGADGAGLGDNPSVSTITVNGIVVGSAASPATGLTLTTGAFMEDIWIDADWDAPADGTAATYDVELARKVGLGYELVQSYSVGGTSIRMAALEPNQVYGVRVTAINRIQVRSITLPPSGFSDITTGLDATIPGQVTGVALTAGIKTMMVTWTEIGDRDVARGTGTYEVQLDTNNGFGTANTRFTSATITSFQGVISGLIYYTRVRAVDNSGNAGPWSVTVSTPTVLTSSDDIGSGAVQTTHIAALAVGNAQIANAAIDNAKIASLSADKITAGTLNADRIGANTLDVNKLTTSTLTSKTITIGAGGVLKIGNAPTTGVLINDQGIRLYSGGAVKVALDVLGTATFEGNISASSITSSTITSATINAGTITGATVRTAASGQRLALENTSIDALSLYTGHGSESAAGRLAVALSGSSLICQIDSPRSSGNDWTQVVMGSVTGGNGSSVNLVIVNGSGTQRGYIGINAASNGSNPKVYGQGIEMLQLVYSVPGTNAEARLVGSGNYGFLYLFGGGAAATLNVNNGLGSGFHLMNNTNATFVPVQASAFNLSSSRSVKVNVREESTSALDRISQMEIVRFQRAKTETQEEIEQLPEHVKREYELDEIGLIAEDVFNIVPEAVLTDETGNPRSINLGILVALALKAIQELSTAKGN